MNKEISNGHNSESSPLKEKWSVSFSAVTISGIPGCGNTVLAKALAEKYDVKLVTVGQLVRERIGNSNSPIINYIKRNVEFDKELDSLQAEEIKRAITIADSPIIIEAKLAGVIATEVSSQSPEQATLSPVVRILVTANEDVRAARIYKREKEKHPDLKTGQVVISHQTTNRWQKDLKRYRELHNQLADIDPWDPKSKDKFYDLVIDTSGLTPEETVEKVHKYLVSQGLVDPI